MHEPGQLEVAPRKGLGDVPQMSSDLGHAGWVYDVPPEADAAAVGQGLEAMRGGGLIDPHGSLTTCLYGRERLINGVLYTTRLPMAEIAAHPAGEGHCE